MTDVTRMLNEIAAGSDGSSSRIIPLVYDELRRLAVAKLASERPDHTLQATALVHEAYLRLVRTSDVTWQGRVHFFGAAAEAMRRILVEAARRRNREKHGGKLQRVELDDFQLPAESFDLCKLDAALDRFTAEDSVAAEVVKLKYFAGLSREEIANLLGLSVHQVRQKWDYARAWLRVALEE